VRRFDRIMTPSG